ncbi:MAG: hypothetical protein LC734_03760 [Acidobacteria bacterium]|nr:hypothetical protein [Acidobacteriota bacterium]
MKKEISRIKLTLLIGTAFVLIGSLTANAQTPTPTPVSAPTGPPVVLGSGISDYTQFWPGQAVQVARWARFPRRDSVPAPSAGWHYHPGYSYYVVVQGTLTVEDGCGGITKYRAGQAFEKSDGRIHRGYVVDDPATPENEGEIDEYEYQTFINPPGRPLAVNVLPRETHGQVMNPCGPARNVDECREYWERFNFPSTFANQGACVAYVNNRRRVTLLVPEDPLS